jgi:hypothetical protein
MKCAGQGNPQLINTCFQANYSAPPSCRKPVRELANLDRVVDHANVAAGFD